MTSPESPTLSLETDRLSSVRVASIYAEHGEGLRAFLLGVLQDGELAEEVLQATFAKVVEAGHTAHSGTMKGWLFQVAYNEAMGYRRKQGIHERATQNLSWIRPQVDSAADVSAIKQELRDRVRQGFDRLAPELQQVVRMRIYEDKTFARIAEELKIPMGTVVTRMRTALKRLGNDLEDLR